MKQLKLTMNKSDITYSHGNPKQLRKHIIIIIGLLFIQFFSRNIWKVYYSEFQRPYMLKTVANLCETYSPILPDYLPPECDIVLVRNIDNVVEETFYTHQGEIRVKVFSKNGIYMNEVRTMLGDIAMFTLPVIGFVGLIVSAFHKIARTGTYITWEMYTHPNDSFEKLLIMYSLPLFLSGCFFH